MIDGELARSSPWQQSDQESLNNFYCMQIIGVGAEEEAAANSRAGLYFLQRWSLANVEEKPFVDVSIISLFVFLSAVLCAEEPGQTPCVETHQANGVILIRLLD